MQIAPSPAATMPLAPAFNLHDRSMFAKVKDHLVRVDDMVVCKSCGKRFDVPSHRNIVFLEELEGLPRDVEEDEEEEL